MGKHHKGLQKEGGSRVDGFSCRSGLLPGCRLTALPVFQAGGLQTVEAAGNGVVGVPRHGTGHHLLGTASSREEAVVIATILRLFNPN